MTYKKLPEAHAIAAKIAKEKLMLDVCLQNGICPDCTGELKTEKPRPEPVVEGGVFHRIGKLRYFCKCGFSKTTY